MRRAVFVISKWWLKVRFRHQVQLSLKGKDAIKSFSKSVKKIIGDDKDDKMIKLMTNRLMYI